MYAQPDPRESLVEKGNALLEVIYKEHLWDQTYPKMRAMMNKGKDAQEEEIQELVNDPEFVTALMESLKLDSEHRRLQTEFLMLRQTIEALSQPRPEMPEEP
jgi:hypothetical protein